MLPFPFLLSIQPAFASGNEKSIGSLLKELDRTIARKTDFQKQREHEIDKIKKQIRASSSATDKYQLYSALYGLYLHYQADSALHILKKGKNYCRSSRMPNTIISNGLREPKF